MNNNRSLINEIITNNKPGKRVPIWLMRQAGRSLPEYREAVKHISNFMDICYNTDLISKLTLQPIERFDMDAAIIFSDILLIAHILGCNIDFIRGMGPKIIPVDSAKCLKDVDMLEYEDLPLMKAIKRVRKKLSVDKSLIGFAGGPWTVATYIIEGGSSKSFLKIKDFPISELKHIIDQLTEATIIYLIKQIDSGVDVIQLFESNAGVLSDALFKEYVIQPTTKIVSSIRDVFGNFPIIGFPRCAGKLYKPYCEETNISAVSLDYNVSIEWAKANLNLPIQGNLHPQLLAYDTSGSLQEAKRILNCFQESPFIFNLGHGVLPETPIENINNLVSFVQRY